MLFKKITVHEFINRTHNPSTTLHHHKAQKYFSAHGGWVLAGEEKLYLSGLVFFS
jgi:hypothetical protein